MKIFCVAYLHGSGGAERQIIMLANAMAEMGHDVTLAVLVEFNKKYEISDRVRVVDLTSIEKKNGNKIFLRYKALQEFYKQSKPDVSIHFWLQSAYLSAFMQRKITGKVIYAERGDPGDAEYCGILGVVRKAAFRRIDGFVFQSEGARDYFGNAVKKKSVVIHNAVSVPADQFLTPCKKRTKRIISVGRLHPQKNQALLIDAFAIIAKKFPEYTLEIYGDGELKDPLQKDIDRYQLFNRITIKPSTKDIFDEIYTSELFVLTSDFEGMPNVLMEAMALGVPSISTDCKPGGARTLIEDGVNGYIIPCNNSALLAERMAFVLENIDAQIDICTKAQEIRKTHKKEIIYEAWERYISQL